MPMTSFERKLYRKGRNIAINDFDESLPTDFVDYFKKATPHWLLIKNKTLYCENGCVVAIKKGYKTDAVITCPKCKQKGTVANVRTTGRSETVCANYLKRVDGGIVERSFVFYKEVFADNKNGLPKVKISIDEEARAYFDFETGRYAYFGRFKPMYVNSQEKWKPGQLHQHGQCWSAWDVWCLPYYTYAKNVKSVVKDSPYQYSQLDAVVKWGLHAMHYLRVYNSEPQMEIFAKLGLKGLLEDCYSSGGRYRDDYYKNFRSAGSLKKFGVKSKEDIKECANLSAIEIIARHMAQGWNVDKSQSKDAMLFAKAIIYRSGDDFEYDFIRNGNLFRYAISQIDLADADRARMLANFFRDYTDYVGTCVELNYNLFDTQISKPKDFKKAHDDIMRLQKYNKSHCYDELVESAFRNIHEYVDFTYKGLSIKMAPTADAIIKEGAEQKHCVGRYVARVAKGESIIAFLRREENPDKAFYTVELKPDLSVLDICQCRGEGNKDYGEDVKEFLSAYENWYNTRPYDYNANEQYAIYYKSVEKRDGKYISLYDGKTEYKVGEWDQMEADKEADNVAVKGMHIASFDFAKRYAGNRSCKIAILEVKVNIHDVIIPNAEDQVRCSRWMITREVPREEFAQLERTQRQAVA